MLQVDRLRPVRMLAICFSVIVLLLASTTIASAATSTLQGGCGDQGMGPQNGYQNQPHIVNLAAASGTSDSRAALLAYQADSRITGVSNNWFNAMSSRDYVYVTKHQMVWIDMNDRAGNVAGYWSLNGAGGTLDFFFDSVNELRPYDNNGHGLYLMTSNAPNDVASENWLSVFGAGAQYCPKPASGGIHELWAFGYSGQQSNPGNTVFDPTSYNGAGSGQIFWHQKYRFHNDWGDFQDLVTVRVDNSPNGNGRMNNVHNLAFFADLSQCKLNMRFAQANFAPGSQLRAHYTESGPGVETTEFVSGDYSRDLFEHTGPVPKPGCEPQAQGTAWRNILGARGNPDAPSGVFNSASPTGYLQDFGTSAWRSLYLYNNSAHNNRRFHLRWPTSNDRNWCLTGMLYHTPLEAESLGVSWWHSWCGQQQPGLPASQSINNNLSVWADVEFHISGRF